MRKCDLCDNDAKYAFRDGDSVCAGCVSKLAKPKETIINLQQQITELQRENAELRDWKERMRNGAALTFVNEGLLKENAELKQAAQDEITRLEEQKMKLERIIAESKEKPIQDGMVVVPVEPTEKMLNAQPHAWPDDAREIWKAMIEASKEKL